MPTMVLPIVLDEVNLATIEATYGLDKRTNCYYLSTRHFLKKFIDRMMEKVKNRHHKLKDKWKLQGRMPTVYEYQNIHTELRINDAQNSEY